MEKLPYEVLIRWNSEGALSGAHVQWLYVFRDEKGALLGEQVSPAEPLGLTEDSKHFPLSGVMDEATKDAIVSSNKANAELVTLRSENEALRRLIEQLETRGR